MTDERPALSHGSIAAVHDPQMGMALDYAVADQYRAVAFHGDGTVRAFDPTTRAKAFRQQQGYEPHADRVLVVSRHGAKRAVWVAENTVGTTVVDGLLPDGTSPYDMCEVCGHARWEGCEATCEAARTPADNNGGSSGLA